MCCGQPVRPLLLVGSSWPRFEADCKHDSFYEETRILDDKRLHERINLVVASSCDIKRKGKFIGSRLKNLDNDRLKGRRTARLCPP
jgi:hypothetical protein